MSPLEIRHAIAAVIELSVRLPRGAPDFENPIVFDFWCKDILPNLDLQRVRDVCRSLSKSLEFFPAPVQFLAAYDGVSASDDEIGLETVQKIRKAMQRFSVIWELDGKYPNWWHERHDAAEEFIGALGWAWVQDQGGWWQVCNGLMDTSDYQWNVWAKGITARYKQTRMFGPNPPPIGMPGQWRPAIEQPPRQALPEPETLPRAQPGKLIAMASQIRKGLGA